MKRKLFLIVSICSISFYGNSQSNPKKNVLQVGIGIVDITGDSAVILDPLHVKAVVMQQGNETIALVECDMIEVDREWSEPARQIAATNTGIPYNNICISATHTHMYSPHKNLQTAVIEAISKAKANLRPVTLKSAIGQQFNVSFNRRYFMKDGSVVFNPMFLNPDIVRPAGPVDTEIGIVLFYDPLTNKPVSSLTNFPLHLDIVKEYGAVYQQTGAGSRNAVSADFPYWIETAFRKDFGKDFHSIFLTGCCGNINHWDFSKPGPQSGWNTKSKQVGDSLYQSIKRALPAAAEEVPLLAARSRVINIPLQSFTAEDLLWANGMKGTQLSKKSEEPGERQQFLNNVKQRRILWLQAQKQKGITELGIDVQVFRLSNETAIVTLPGEMFVEFALTIKNFSPFKNTIVVEMSNNGVAYVPHKKAFTQGGYEVENSRLAAGGGEMLAEAALQMLKELKTDIN
jgi:neutral ceramidase